jgi:hypothetical protein
MRSLLLLSLVIFVCFSCNKEKTGNGEPVEIYLLKTSQPITGKCQTDPATAVLEDNPLVRNQDILEYYQNTFEFKLSATAFQKVNSLSDRTPFAVTVNKQVIYYGFCKPGFSSSSCDHSITMGMSWTSDNKIMLRLGYPGLLSGVSIDDQRNNPQLLVSLQKQGKLRP